MVEKNNSDMEKEYEKMLDHAYENMPSSYYEAERFEIPKVRGHVEGNKTIISNLQEIISTLAREQEHIIKYLLKELATTGVYSRGKFILKGKISASMINQKIKQYAKTYVLCEVCGKPDTKIVKEKDVTFIKCMACGAKYHIKSKI